MKTAWWLGVMVFLGCSSPQTPPLAVDQPAAGQAIITGTTQTILWHGGRPHDIVDVLFVPSSGAAPVTLARAVPNSGKTDVVLHLLSDDERAGGAVTVQASAASSSSALESRSQALGGDDGGGASGVSVGCLAGFSWNGTSEDYFWMDVTTGDKQQLGTVGDLQSWNLFRPLAIDHDAGRIYIIGMVGLTQNLYVLDAKSGALLHQTSVSAHSYSALTLVGGHRLLAFYYDTQEEMVEIDTASGADSIIGQVGDLMTWSGQAAYDATSDTMYVLGMPGSGGWKLYSLNATSGAAGPSSAVTLNGAPIDQLLGALVNARGELLGFRYDAAGAAEQMLRVDVASGAATVIGTVGDLTSWSMVAEINRTTDTIYVIGNDPASSARLYVLDGDGGAFLYSTPLADYPTQAVLVY